MTTLGKECLKLFSDCGSESDIVVFIDAADRPTWGSLADASPNPPTFVQSFGASAESYNDHDEANLERYSELSPS